MSEPVAAKSPDLAGLGPASAVSDHGANGFDHRHVVGAEHLVEIARRFAGAGYVLEMMTCTDLRFVDDAEPAFRLSYTYNRFTPGAHDRHLVVADLAAEVGVEAPSVSGVHPAADWFEREVYDMYGVRFGGHPDLKRILLPDDADFHALLKDFGRIEDAEDADDEGEGDA